MSERPSPQPILEMVHAFRHSRIVLTALELDIFTAVEQGDGSSADAAKRVGADARAADRLMNSLAALELLEKKDGRFSNTPLASAFLVRGKPGFIHMFRHQAHLWESWSTLTESVRSGTCAPRRELKSRDQEWFDSFIAAMHWRGKEQAPGLAAKLDLSGVRRVLDVGGGSGVYAMAIARARPGLEAVVFDLPGVVPLTRRYVREAGLSERVTAAAGDYTADELGAGYDLVLLSAIIHSNPPDGNRSLFQKAARALNPGGRIAISDFIMDEDRTSPAHGAMFALNMLVATEAGDTYTFSEVRGWLEEAGFSGVSIRDDERGTRLITARKG